MSDEIKDDIAERLTLMAGHVGRLWGEATGVRLGKKAEKVAGELAVALGAGGREAAEAASTLLVCGVISHDELSGPELWRTALGRQIMIQAGNPAGPVVPATTAAALLGVTKARVYQMVEEGKLALAAEGGVTTESLMPWLTPCECSAPAHQHLHTA